MVTAIRIAIERETARLQAILDIPNPGGKPGARIRRWENRQEQAMRIMLKLENGDYYTFNPESHHPNGLSGWGGIRYTGPDGRRSRTSGGGRTAD